MAIICCHIINCNASVQYFAILHTHKYCKMSRKPENKYTLTFICKKCNATEFAAKNVGPMTYVNCHAAK